MRLLSALFIVYFHTCNFYVSRFVFHWDQKHTSTQSINRSCISKSVWVRNLDSGRFCLKRCNTANYLSPDDSNYRWNRLLGFTKVYVVMLSLCRNLQLLKCSLWLFVTEHVLTSWCQSQISKLFLWKSFKGQQFKKWTEALKLALYTWVVKMFF